VQGHLGGHARQCLHEKVGCSHTRLDRAEGMLDRLASPTHGLRILVEPLLDSLQHMLVLPPCDPALHSCRAAAFQCAAPARIGPVAMQRQPVLDVGEVVFQPFASGAAIDVILRQIREVLLAKAALRLGARGHRLRQGYGDAGLIARDNLLAVEVAAIGDRLQGIGLQRAFGFLGDARASCERSEPTLVTSCVTIR